jgi:hypothetical protein
VSDEVETGYTGSSNNASNILIHVL